MRAPWLWGAVALLIGGSAVAGGRISKGTELSLRGVTYLQPTKSPDWAEPEVRRAGEPLVRSVVFVSLDTFRRDYLSAYGDVPDLPVSHSTPNMDALAARGALFLDAIASGASTGISHHAMLHGLPAPVSGKTDHRRVIGGDVAHPLETLQAAGLRTVAFTGEGQMAPSLGWSVGFDEHHSVAWRLLGIDDPEKRELAQIEQLSFEWLDANGSEPFFLFLHSYELHCPYWPPPEERERYTSWYDGPLDIIRCGDVSHGEIDDLDLLRALYAGSVAHADAFIGRLVSKLESLGRFEDTLLILTTDHGEQLGEGDGFIGHGRFHPSITRVPLIVHLPGAAPARIDAPVSGIDLLPTIYSALGLDPPYPLPGEELLPLLRGDGTIRGERIRFAHEELGSAAFEREWQFESWWPDREALTHWRGPGAGTLRNAPDVADRLRAAQVDLYERHRDLRGRFRVVRQLGNERDGELEKTREALRALGYVD